MSKPTELSLQRIVFALLWGLANLACNASLSPSGALRANECGSSSQLPAEFERGATCESLCGPGVWACEDGDAVCVEFNQNECGGCGQLPGELGAPCGLCDTGLWQCRDTEAACVGAASINPCGGCKLLALSDGAGHGDECGPCGGGVAVCDGTERLRCEAPNEYNACGGCGDLPNALGERCGVCEGGLFECVDSTVACVDRPDLFDSDRDGVADPCDCDHAELECAGREVCVEQGASVQCGCRPGDARDANGECQLVNECAADEPVCPPLIACVDRVDFAECGTCAAQLRETDSGCCAESPFGIGSGSACVILGGRVKCWGGRNERGSLGLGSTEGFGDDPNEMGDELPWVDLGDTVTVAVEHERNLSCALSADGELRCWGDNEHGQLGQGDTEHRGDEPGEMGAALPPINIGSNRQVVQFSISREHVCVLTDNHQIKCWGRNNEGQLGLGHTRSIGTAAEHMGDNLLSAVLPRGEVPVKVVTLDLGTCALVASGRVYCWGDSFQGGLGIPGDSDVGVADGQMGDALVPSDFGDGFAVEIAAGYDHVCVLLDSGEMKCWGDNSQGRLGLGHTDPVPLGNELPVVGVGEGRRVLSIHMGGHHTCVLLDDRTLKCWGRNRNGQSGQPAHLTYGNHPGETGDGIPIVNLGDRAIESVGAGDGMTCVLFTDGTTSCFGNNDLGALGRGHTLPHQPETIDDFASLPAMQFGTGVSVGCGAE